VNAEKRELVYSNIMSSADTVYYSQLELQRNFIIEYYTALQANSSPTAIGRSITDYVKTLLIQSPTTISKPVLVTSVDGFTAEQNNYMKDILERFSNENIKSPMVRKNNNRIIYNAESPKTQYFVAFFRIINFLVTRNTDRLGSNEVKRLTIEYQLESRDPDAYRGSKYQSVEYLAKTKDLMSNVLTSTENRLVDDLILQEKLKR
jgi:hypothetical protein